MIPDLHHRRAVLRSSSAYSTLRTCLNIFFTLEIMLLIAGAALQINHARALFLQQLHRPDGLAFEDAATVATFGIAGAFLILLLGSVVVWALMHAVFDIADAAISTEAAANFDAAERAREREQLSSGPGVPRNRINPVALLALLAILFTGANAMAANPPPATAPNILFIAIDDLNDWEGCLGGHPQAKTPNLDRLAARGTLFYNAHCQAPLCNSSRTSILTGLRPSTTGVYGLDPWFRISPRFKDYVTLPQYFSRHGYTTMTAGKVYHDAYPPRADRVDGAEFDVWGYHGSFGPAPKQKFVQTPDPTPLMDWGVFPERDDQQEDWKVADWGVQQLRAASKEKRFFLCVGFRRPHVPCYATQKWFDLYPEESLILPPVKEDDRADTPGFSWFLHWKLPEPRLSWLRQSGQWRPLVRAYLASISFVDSQVGRLLDALDVSGLANRTVIVLWSDHGWHLGEKAITGKNTLWERSTRVPLIFAGPGVAKNAVCQQPVELLDIFPTLVELCGLPARSDLEGHSLVPQLKDARAPRPWPAITTHGPHNHSVRTERWRYIQYANGAEELYDTSGDPNEWNNLAHDPQMAAVMSEHRRWLPQTNLPPLPGRQIRVVEVRRGIPYWEDKPIVPGETAP